MMFRFPLRCWKDGMAVIGAPPRPRWVKDLWGSSASLERGDISTARGLFGSILKQALKRSSPMAE